MDRPPEQRREPRVLGDVLSHLFALRGYAKFRGDRQLQELWREAAGETVARQTRVAGVTNGVLQVGVASSALLSELASFHKWSLLERLQQLQPQIPISDIRFKLRGDLASPGLQE